MSSIKVSPYSWSPKWKVPTSKSYANRALIVSALKSEAITLQPLSESRDVLNLMKALRLVGVKIDHEGDSCCVYGNFLRDEVKTNKVIEVESGDGGTTTRFLMALLARGSNQYLLKPSGGMKKRPMNGLVNALRELGACIERDQNDNFMIQGPINNNKKKISVDCTQTSQFLSALHLATWDLEINYQAIGLVGSSIYVQQTLDVIKNITTIPIDFSSAAYPLTLGALIPSVSVENCSQGDPYQADSIIIKILKGLGIELEFSTQGVSVFKRPQALEAIDIDASGFPDLVPTLCFLASYCSGESCIRNVHSLEFKESNRIKETSRILSLFHIEHDFTDPLCLKIKGSPLSEKVPPVIYHAADDHRMIMVAALFMAINSGGEIQGFEAVVKSYPHFFDYIST